MTREELETEAKRAVCSCWYYDLCNDIDTLTDEQLQKIINYPAWPHLENQIHNPVSGQEFIEELANCQETAITL